MNAVDLTEELLAAANADTVAPPEIEFIGEDNPEFGAKMADALRHPTNDSKGRRYRLVKMVFEEI